MQDQRKAKPNAEAPQETKTRPKASIENTSASGRWAAVHRTRLPHKTGLPLSSGGCGDSVER